MAGKYVPARSLRLGRRHDVGDDTDRFCGDGGGDVSAESAIRDGVVVDDVRRAGGGAVGRVGG